MKRHGNLFDKIIDIENLKFAHKMASKDKQHYKDIKKTSQNLDEEIQKIHESLKSQTYSIIPKDYTLRTIYEPKERVLYKLKYNPHRIVQWAIMLQIEKIFTKNFCFHVCSSVPNAGINRATKLMIKYLKDPEETKYCLKIDVSKYYPSIDKNILKSKLREKFKDPRLLWLFDTIIDSYPEPKGVPIGSYLSQYFANFYLSEFDHYLKESLGLKYIIRYMDDVVILGASKTELHKIRQKIQNFWDSRLNLKMKPNFQIYPVESRCVDFVGFVFRHFNIKLRKSTKLKLRKLTNTIKKSQKLNYSQFCAINSYLGLFQYFDNYGLYTKYIYPISFIIDGYYETFTRDPAKQRIFKKKRIQKLRTHRILPKSGFSRNTRLQTSLTVNSK